VAGFHTSTAARKRSAEGIAGGPVRKRTHSVSTPQGVTTYTHAHTLLLFRSRIPSLVIRFPSLTLVNTGRAEAAEDSLELISSLPDDAIICYTDG
jgi:hypothetical protein